MEIRIFLKVTLELECEKSENISCKTYEIGNSGKY